MDENLGSPGAVDTAAVELARCPVADLLVASGWSPGRQVAVDDVVELLAAEGHRFSPRSRALLVSLAGLTLWPDGDLGAADARSGPHPDPVVIDPVGSGSGELDRIRLAEASLGVELAPLGEVGLDLLATDPTGRLVRIGVVEVGVLGDDLCSSLCQLLRPDPDRPTRWVRLT